MDRGMSEPFEARAAREIRAWKKHRPGAVGRATGFAVAPLARLVRRAVPEAAVIGALDLAQHAASWLADTRDLLREAGAERIEDLRRRELEDCDRAAASVHAWAVGMAAVEGTAAGTVGALGEALDIPIMVTLALRTVHKIGLCYGYECETDTDRQYVFGILSVASANSTVEKRETLAALRGLERLADAASLSTDDGMGRRVIEKISRDATSKGVSRLARRLMVNLTKRKALSAFPVVGMVVGGTTSAWYLRDVGWAARNTFRERRMRVSGWISENSDI